MMNYWLEKEESKMGGWFHSNAYQLHWCYYFWKNGELESFMLDKQLKSLIKNNPEALKYFNKNKRKLNTDEEYETIKNTIKIYNESGRDYNIKDMPKSLKKAIMP